MHSKSLFRIAFSVFLRIPAQALACGPDSASTHFGTLSGVDRASGTFSILDTETRQDLTFDAAPELVETLDNASGTLRVRYATNGNTLTATDISE